MTTSGREEVLARIRAAIGDRAAAEEPTGAYRREGDLTGEALLDRLAERLVDYGAQVRRVSEDTLAAVIEAALAARGARPTVVPPALGLALPGWAEVTVDDTGLCRRSDCSWRSLSATAARVAPLA